MTIMNGTSQPCDTKDDDDDDDDDDDVDDCHNRIRYYTGWLYRVLEYYSFMTTDVQ